MSLKALLFLAPVAAGGWYFAQKDTASGPAGNDARTTAEASPVATHRKSREECLALEQRLLLAAAPGDRNAARAVVAVFTVERELSRQGCGAIDNPGEGAAFRPVSNRMGAAPASRIHTSHEAPNGSPDQDRRPTGVSFEPGRPMVDVSRGHSR